MIEPALQDDALLADIAAASRELDRFHLWWLGQSGFLVHWQGHFALLDPYLSDSLTQKYASTDKPQIAKESLTLITTPLRQLVRHLSPCCRLRAHYSPVR